MFICRRIYYFIYKIDINIPEERSGDIKGVIKSRQSKDKSTLVKRNGKTNRMVNKTLHRKLNIETNQLQTELNACAPEWHFVILPAPYLYWNILFA